MPKTSETLNVLQTAVTESSSNEFVKEWKDQGKGVVGWFCTYVPEEMIYAAGFLPFRITGSSSETNEADSYLYSNTCSYARSCLEEGIRGGYDFLDGIVSCNTCDAMRRLHDVWRGYLKTPFTHILAIPHKISENTLLYYRDQLSAFKTRLEELTGKKITESDLQNAIDVYNQSRTLLRKLYDLRKKEKPPISGAETLGIVRAGMVMPKSRYNELLARVIAEIQEREIELEGNVRLLVSGSIIDQPEYIEAIEGSGALIVADDLCTGTRYFWDPVEPDSDPLEALAKRYLYRAPCARMSSADSRFDHLLNLIKDFRVTGVICETIKFCDLYGYDRPSTKKILDREGIPFLELEREYGLGGLGQIKTRVQAFLEMIGG